MALEPRDIERMIMQAHYRQAISQSSASDGNIVNMNEREQYQSQIRELIEAVETMLDANKKMGEDNKVLTEQMMQANAKMEAMQTYISTLEDKVATLEGKMPPITAIALVRTTRRLLHPGSQAKARPRMRRKNNL